MKYLVLSVLFFSVPLQAIKQKEAKAVFSAFKIVAEAFTTTFNPKPKSIKEAVKMARETVERTHLGEESIDITSQGWKNLGDQALGMSLMFYEMSQEDQGVEPPKLDESLVVLLSFIEQIHGSKGYFTQRASQLKATC